ncbi:unnamed protein product [Heligmosomoides polygyrus]|uniref:EB domain-containing protein n=1 Tax=Heligmosomoides polygyrus TaxID=6339 RepID=A0A183FVC7_HELPZ|nr:unnamed protein product [Heligmosomoides polygyrus]
MILRHKRQEVEATTAPTTEEGEASSTSAPATCVFNNLCYSNEDCPGGQCVGAFVGKCNCNGCVNLGRCDDDSLCGGLKGSCDLKVDICDCSLGFVKAGYSSYGAAMTFFCNVKNCTRATAAEDCLGLQCNFGTCVC